MDHKEAAPLPARLQIGNYWYHKNKHVVPMQDSAPLYRANRDAELRERLNRDGFLLLRNLIPVQSALAARKALLQNVQKKVGGNVNSSVAVVGCSPCWWS